MTRLARTATALAAMLVAALALVSTAAGGEHGPHGGGGGIRPVGGLTAGTGCAVQCLRSALVTTTTTTARVDLATTVPAYLTVTVSRVAGSGGGLAAPTTVARRTVPAFAPSKRVWFTGLQPGTTYAISVRATDLQGRSATRSGAFATRAVETAIDTPAGDLSSGAGCQTACIRRATLAASGSVPGRARLELRTTVPATFAVTLVARDAEGDPIHQAQVVTGSPKTSHGVTLDGLLTGTTYAVTVKATDEQGRTRVEQGSFRTRSAEVVVTYHRLTVTSDGDKGVARGEVSFDYQAADAYRGGSGFRKISSGDTVAAIPSGTSRPGVSIVVPADGRRLLDLTVRGVECDAVSMKNCVVEASRWTSGGYAGDLYVVTSTSVDLREAFTGGGALPPGYGTGLPAGHDLYVVWETTGYALKYRVLATVDVRVV